MPKIQDAFKTITVSLPSYEGSEIKLKTNIPVGDVLEAQKLDDEMETGIQIATKTIVGWNFENEKGETLPITKENILKFPLEDVTFLLEKIAPTLQKKTSGKTKR